MTISLRRPAAIHQVIAGQKHRIDQLMGLVQMHQQMLNEAKIALEHMEDIRDRAKKQALAKKAKPP